MAETFTLNYNWTKPEIGASIDVWGGFLNTDLDGIDSTVHGIQASVPSASSATPAMDGIGAAGSAATFARGDHVHPTDTSRYSTSNPAGYQTAAQVAAVVPAASSTTPVMDGTAAVGVGTTYARADHVHPSDTSKYSTTNPSGYQTAAQVTASLGAYLPLAGGTMTGAISLAADPASALQPATKQYVDAKSPPNPNRLDNGDMAIDQRFAGASAANINGSFPLVDRWKVNGTIAAKFTSGRNFGGSPAVAGFPYYLGMTATTTFSLVAANQFSWYQGIEADNIGDLGFGTAGAQPVTLSFWASSSLTGSFSGALQNGAGNRSYPFSYSIPIANTPTKISVTIPGDTAGTWALTGNATGMYVIFDLGSGTTFRGTANAWAAAALNGVTGAVSPVVTSGAKFAITGVKLEAGNVATAYSSEPLESRISRCQRYFCKSYNMADVPGTANQNGATVLQVAAGTSGMFAPVSLPVRMRTSPTVTTYSTSVANSSGRVTTSAGEQNSGIPVQGESGFSAGYGGSTSMSWINFQWTADAEF